MLRRPVESALTPGVALLYKPPQPPAGRVLEALEFLLGHQPLVERAIDHRQLLQGSDAARGRIDHIRRGVRSPLETLRHVHLDCVRWPSVTPGRVATRRKAHMELTGLPHHGKPKPQGRSDARGAAIPCHPRNVDRIGTRQGVHPSSQGRDQSSPPGDAEGPICHAREPHGAPAGHAA